MYVRNDRSVLKTTKEVMTVAKLKRRRVRAEDASNRWKSHIAFRTTRTLTTVECPNYVLMSDDGSIYMGTIKHYCDVSDCLRCYGVDSFQANRSLRDAFIHAIKTGLIPENGHAVCCKRRDQISRMKTTTEVAEGQGYVKVEHYDLEDQDESSYWKHLADLVRTTR